MLGEHDVNNGVFLLNLRHPLVRPLVEHCIRHVESLTTPVSSFQDDQCVMHAWLLSQRESSGRIPVVQCYTDGDYNLFNYDGGFIRHVLREFGSFDARLRELRRLADEARRTAEEVVDRTQPAQGAFDIVSIGRPATIIGPASSFQKEHRILVAAPAAYHHPPPSARWLIESCRRYGIELTLLGEGQPYPHNRRKIGLVAEHLRDHPEYRYVLQIDLKDIVFCATLQEIFFKYQSFGHAIVAAGERNCWPIPSHAERQPEVGTSARYLNSGSIFSTADAWLAAWERMQEKERRMGGQPPEMSFNGFHMFNCDQGAWSDLYVNREANIVVDSRCILFQPLFQTDCHIAAANRDFIFEGRRIVNRETGGRPCLIHANGCIPLEPWAKYVLDPSSVWIWPLIDCIRNADLPSLRDVAFVEYLLLELGLHDPTNGFVPDSLLAYTGKGLSIWRCPNEFARYLVWLAARPPIRSYLEIGVESGGSFITTTEYLRRFHPLRAAIGLDPVLSPPVFDYVSRSDGVHFIQGTQASEELRWLIEQLGEVDLVFIDGDHSPDAVRADWEFARSHSRYVAFHKIMAKNRPGVTSLWEEIRSTHPKNWEFVDSRWRPNLGAGIGAVELQSHDRYGASDRSQHVAVDKIGAR
jgi:hypothetical protein